MVETLRRNLFGRGNHLSRFCRRSTGSPSAFDKSGCCAGGARPAAIRSRETQRRGTGTARHSHRAAPRSVDLHYSPGRGFSGGDCRGGAVREKHKQPFEGGGAIMG